VTKVSDELRLGASTARDVSQEVRTPTEAEELINIANHMEAEADRLEGKVGTSPTAATTIMSDGDKHPAPTLSGAPDRELELALKRNPKDQQAQVDVGCDGSMDASDPPAVCQPGGSDPAPSNDFPDTELR
jgi:hypothetical protein